MPRDPIGFSVIPRGFSLHRVPAIAFVGGIPLGLEFFGDFGFFGFGVFVVGRIRIELGVVVQVAWSVPHRVHRFFLSRFRASRLYASAFIMPLVASYVKHKIMQDVPSYAKLLICQRKKLDR